jgi:hypothetical protein
LHRQAIQFFGRIVVGHARRPEPVRVEVPARRIAEAGRGHWLMIDAGRSAFRYKPDEICSLRALPVVTPSVHSPINFAVLHNTAARQLLLNRERATFVALDDVEQVRLRGTKRLWECSRRRLTAA